MANSNPNSNPLVKALVTFFKGDVKVVKGQMVRVGHDVHKGCEHLFTKLGADFDYDKAEYEARDKALAEKAVAQAKADAEAAAKQAAEDVKDEVAEVETEVKADVDKAAS